MKRKAATKIKPDPRNARKHGNRNKALIRESLEAVGPLRSIGVDGDNVIRAGNGVFEQAEALGLKVKIVDAAPNELIAVRRKDLKGKRAVEAALYDNRAGEVESTWDTDVLAEIARRDGDLVGRLFEGDRDILAAIAPQAEADAEPQIDRAEELQEKWQVKTGDLWRIGEHRLLCGDSTKREDVERVMGGERGAVVTDPPYGIKVDTSWLSALHIQRGKPPNKNDDKLRGDDGTLDLSWLYQYGEWLVFGFPFVARYEKYTGLLVWDKRGDGGEGGLGNPVEVAASNTFNGYRLSRHVWAGYVREAGEKREAHPTQKPIGIMVDAVQIVKNAIILDPFVGSGTTIVACQNLCRKCRAIEISPAYVSVCLQRMSDAFPGIEIERIDDGEKATQAKAAACK